MIKQKEKYIKNRYMRAEQTNTNRLFNGFHIQKGKRIARPFSSFFPNPANIQKKSPDR